MVFFYYECFAGMRVRCPESSGIFLLRSGALRGRCWFTRVLSLFCLLAVHFVISIYTLPIYFHLILLIILSRVLSTFRACPVCLFGYLSLLRPVFCFLSFLLVLLSLYPASVDGRPLIANWARYISQKLGYSGNGQRLGFLTDKV